MNIKLVGIRELFGKTFLIPDYQRGYRWTKKQVEDLLKDILDFQKKNSKKEGEFYCLQPIIVKKLKDNTYEVIDGQQRLTTVLLILLHFKKKIEEDFYIEEFYRIDYRTRQGLSNFIENIDKIDEKDISTNIDLYYLKQAWDTINNWVKSNVINGTLNKSDYLNTLLKWEVGGSDKPNNVRFIWYEVDTRENGEEIFTRINRGKIPLTNSELIKALFLKENNNTRISYEWEYIEKMFNHDNFWFFLGGKRKHKNQDDIPKNDRMSLVFDLVADGNNKGVNVNVQKFDTYYSFYIFNELISLSNTKREDLWNDIKHLFHLIEEWYRDYEYYHLVGYLLNISDGNLGSLVRSYKEKDKQNFKLYIKKQIGSKVIKEKENPDEEISKDRIKEYIKSLSYGEDSNDIENLLMLYNIILILKSGYIRFPFDVFGKGEWSIEHIHARNSENLRRIEDRRKVLKEEIDWLKKREEYKHDFEQKLAEAGIESIENIESFTEEDIQKIENIIYDLFSDRGNYTIDTIDNLTLLPKDINSAMKNRVFPVKREILIKKEKEGAFIPEGTRKVFYKKFIETSDNNFKWGKIERESYLNDIVDEIYEFLIRG